MRRDDEHRDQKRLQLQERAPEPRTRDEHVVFDFTGLERPDVTDLALILTARLHMPTEQVWVRALPWHTARMLEAMHLDHLFPVFPEDPTQPN